jgi:hypothetical protein
VALEAERGIMAAQHSIALLEEPEVRPLARTAVSARTGLAAAEVAPAVVEPPARAVLVVLGWSGIPHMALVVAVAVVPSAAMLQQRLPEVAAGPMAAAAVLVLIMPLVKALAALAGRASSSSPIRHSGASP